MKLVLTKYDGPSKRTRRDKRSEQASTAESNTQDYANLLQLVRQYQQCYVIFPVRVPVAYLDTLYDLEQYLNGLDTRDTDSQGVLKSFLGRVQENEQQLRDLVEEIQALSAKCIAYKNKALEEYLEQENVCLHKLIEANFSSWRVLFDLNVFSREMQVANFLSKLDKEGLLQRNNALRNNIFEQAFQAFAERGFACRNIDDLREKCGTGPVISAIYKSKMEIYCKNILINLMGSVFSIFGKSSTEHCQEIYEGIINALKQKAEDDYAVFVKENFMQKALMGLQKKLDDCRELREMLEK